MQSIVANFITPAFIASVVTVFFNIRAEKLKAHREYVTSYFEAARTAVSNAVAAAANYFTLPGAQRTAGLQTHLYICEREARCALSMVCEWGPRLEPPMSIDRVQDTADTFIDALTADTFGSADCDPSPNHAQQIAALGADLRDELTRSRQRQLEAWVSTDGFQRFLIFMKKPMGPLHYRE